MGFFCARKSIISALTGKIAAKGGRIVKNLKIVIICLGLCFLAACGDKEAAPSGDKMISLYVAESGEITEMPLEEYLCGVVAAEMDVNWPKEALAAQAAWMDSALLQQIWLIDGTESAQLETVCLAFCSTHPNFAYCPVGEAVKIFGKSAEPEKNNCILSKKHV